MGLASSIYKARCNCQCSLLCDPHALRTPRRGQKLCVKWLKPSPVDKFHEVEPASERKTPPECKDTESINLQPIDSNPMNGSTTASMSPGQPDRVTPFDRQEEIVPPGLFLREEYVAYRNVWEACYRLHLRQ
ncbi:hypothetical protein PGT21_033986 [Puccinia graminis f. sp. tritici]|uniref:Uncharacterized protein n=1 Tax=Puccinia graminis f. sp. tritici TaxID=56615 RepID=A0A5B0PC43_PUCGR|nr:hypothetical protein PGT21_033986 [Puccinia graminis f. sp. tritici]KAA1125621.1 hypothetical protein PGTUg99_012560 [Puccinia graminis f. sp. tritici]